MAYMDSIYNCKKCGAGFRTEHDAPLPEIHCHYCGAHISGIKTKEAVREVMEVEESGFLPKKRGRKPKNKNVSESLKQFRQKPVKERRKKDMAEKKKAAPVKKATKPEGTVKRRGRPKGSKNKAKE